MYSINIDKNLEVRGIDPRAFRMQIELSTTELILLAWKVKDKMDIINIIWHDFFEEGKGASIYSILWGYS